MTGPTAQPVSAVYGGIRYAGELVRAAAWEPSLGSALDGDVYFRVVFLESPPAPLTDDLRDSRIAVHVPGPPSPARERAEAELRTLREAQAGYAADVGDSLAAQAHEIEEQVVEEWASSFRGGRVVASPPLDLDVAAVFASGYWSAWAARIGQALLARAYPDLPVDAAKLSSPLRPDEDGPALFEAIRGAESDFGSVALDAFGAALGIARKGRGTLDLSRCAGVDLVAAEAEHHSGAALGHRLAHGLGLTYPLATLFALLYVLRGSAEVRLAPTHGLRLRSGDALDEPRITTNILPHLAWPARFWPDVDGIGPAGAPDAEDTGPYLDVLGLTDDSGLRAWLGTMSDGLLSVTQALIALAAAQGRELDADELEALWRVRRLIEVEDAADVGARAREVFGSIGPFRTGMALWTSWREGLEHAAALTGAIALVERAVVEEARSELSMERAALASRLRDPALLTSPQQWPALAEAARRFFEAYADAYVEHHDAYHLQMELLAYRMDGVGAQGGALAQLNEVTELGRPIAPELPGLCEELRNVVLTCGAAPERETIARDAVCPSCALRLDAVPPTAEVEALAASVREALGKQNARLAKAVAHRLLKREANERLDRFIQVVEVSDLSGLANILDDELVAFLGALLREERS
ncbi:MAG: hypothetical protein J4N31_01970 [Chloroflexi bacterium]|nr:hypothetical protein [Chloroflexota bacterium]